MMMSNILSDKEIQILQDTKFIDGLNQYMMKEKIAVILINNYVFYAQSSKFKERKGDEIIVEPDNCFNLYHFFIKYQYYNFAASVRANMFCIIPKK
jgi:hypothetical protein